MGKFLGVFHSPKDVLHYAILAGAVWFAHPWLLTLSILDSNDLGFYLGALVILIVVDKIVHKVLKVQ